MQRFLLLGVLASASLVGWASAGEPGPSPPRDIRQGGYVEKVEPGVDYKDRLPRIPPREPDEALKSSHLIPGFRIELAAAEPLVCDPVDLCFDEQGRMYVAEMIPYAEGNSSAPGSPGGRVSRLEDTDGDGRFDLRTVYVDKLIWPTGELRLESGGAQFGMTFDVWGRKFESSNSTPIEMVMADDRYLGRNPYLAPPSPRVRIWKYGSTIFRTSPLEPWRVVRTEMRVRGVFSGPIEGGGTPAGYFTAACGVMIYKGHAWPEEFRGNAFVCEGAGNLVHRMRLEPDGVGLAAYRTEEGREFLTSDDVWFKPVQLANGPDGNLYIADARVRHQLAFTLGELPGPRATAALARIVARDVPDMKGDVPAGREVFKRECAKCHRLEGVGYDLGLPLATVKSRGREGVLMHILDPNREVNPTYLNYTVLTDDGLTVTGMIAAETPTSIELRRSEEESDTVLRAEIDVMQSSGLSIMPEGLEKQITKREMADLLEYLMAVQ